METITIEIDAPTAKQYRKFTPELKNRFNRAVNITLKKMMNDASFNDYSKLLDDLSDQAVKNGLTPEILEELLKDD